MNGRRTMEGDSLKYDCAYAAGMLIYERFLPEPHKPDALILGQLVFIVNEAINEFERRQGESPCRRTSCKRTAAATVRRKQRMNSGSSARNASGDSK
jgi:hypothetical protein